MPVGSPPAPDLRPCTTPTLLGLSRLTSSLRIVPIPGFTPTIGRLVSMLTYARQSLPAAVDGLSRRELDHLHDASSNTIGALLAHASIRTRLGS